MSKISDSKQDQPLPFSEVSQKAFDVFIESAGKISANMLGIVGKVGGQIYALLFLSKRPLSLDEIVARLEISKSNISINIRLLEDYKLVRQVWVKGSRKDYYEACRDSPKKLLRDFFDRIRDGVHESIELIHHCQSQFEKMASLEGGVNADAEGVEFAQGQLQLLLMFYQGAHQLFESFYSGGPVDIEVLRRAILD